MEGFILTPAQRAGLLVAVISGGRPALRERPTARFLPAFDGAGFADVVWVVSSLDAGRYEPDTHPTITYPQDWAYEYARTHWMLPTPPEPDGFLGAFPGREWACLEAERRGCWGVLQLDDNVVRINFPRGGKGASEVAQHMGALPGFADLLGACVLATNGRMIGANLDSLPTIPPSECKVIRAGFPYSMFVEQTGAGREPWYGPFEDDITHAFQYGTRADGATAAIMPLLRYAKRSTGSGGMRAQYGHSRAVQLQRIFPESAKVGIRATRSNGKGGARIYHTMLTGAIRNRLVVNDQALYRQVNDRIQTSATLYTQLARIRTREKIADRLAKLGL